MQERPGPGAKGKNPLDRSATAGHRFSELTGRQPVIPQRPPGMMRVEQPPATPRVARPQHEPNKVRKPKTWKWWTAFGCVSVVVLIAGGMIIYGAMNLFFAASVALGPANTAADFLSSLKTADYDQAYTDLDAALTVQLAKNDFKQMAQADDHCYGQVTDYNEVDGSATSSPDGNTQSFDYNISRSKLKKPYQLHLTLQKDAAGDWNITSYGGDLGPAPPTCK
ncbi:MAG TPA: hypothetical protein VFV38_44910 [Ktedonobacteraceae bacterium]|nr:hypothetical protein [Ktedonobacteraceae bacterium]